MSTGQVLSHPIARGTADNPAALQPTDGQADPSLASVRQRRAALAIPAQWRAWWRGAGARVSGRMPGTPALWYRTFRRWSPGIIPPLLGTMLLLAAGAIATHSAGQQPALVDPHTLLVLFIVYLIIGTAYGVLLYLASSTTVWWSVLLMGVAVYVIATFGVIGGPAMGVLTVIVLLAVAARYNYLHMQVVPEGHVLVTTFAGGYHRTLQAGKARLLPGEHAAATLDTTERRFTCPTQRAGVSIGNGETYTARAAATVAYNLLPEEAYRAALAPDEWEQHLHDLVCSSLQLALEDWGERMIVTEGGVQDGTLARAVLTHLREQARAQGVHVAWVNVRDIWLAPGGETLPVDTWDDAGEDEGGDDDTTDETRQGEARGYTPALPAARPSLAPPPPGPEPEPQEEPLPEETTSAEAQEAGLEEGDLLSAEVLSDAYEAVRDGHIHDPATIRELAQAFLRVAADPALNTEFPYDAMQAAQILIERAKRLDRDHRAAARSFDGN